MDTGVASQSGAVMNAINEHCVYIFVSKDLYIYFVYMEMLGHVVSVCLILPCFCEVAKPICGLTATSRNPSSTSSVTSLNFGPSN